MDSADTTVDDRPIVVVRSTAPTAVPTRRSDPLPNSPASLQEDNVVTSLDEPVSTRPQVKTSAT